MENQERPDKELLDTLLFTKSSIIQADAVQPRTGQAMGKSHDARLAFLYALNQSSYHYLTMRAFVHLSSLKS